MAGHTSIWYMEMRVPLERGATHSNTAVVVPSGNRLGASGVFGNESASHTAQPRTGERWSGGHYTLVHEGCYHLFASNHWEWTRPTSSSPCGTTCSSVAGTQVETCSVCQAAGLAQWQPAQTHQPPLLHHASHRQHPVCPQVDSAHAT